MSAPTGSAATPAPAAASRTRPAAEASQDDLAGQLRALTDAVAALTDRIASLEGRLEAVHPTGEVTDDVLLAIAAACAAFLGKRATVKQVHLRRHSTWAKQGRAEVQYSHAISHPRG